MPLVSVLMSSYNHEKFVPIAIESVFRQTFTDFELIIIDDASKDRSREVIKDYVEKDGRIRAIFHDENQGVAKTLNECIDEANGKFIAFIDSDDVWVKDKLKKQIEMLDKNEDLVIWSEGLIIDAKGNATGELFTQMYRGPKRKKSGDIFQELLNGNFILHSSLILKKGNLEDIRYNGQLKYLNDYQFEVDLARKYEYCFVPEPLVMYRIHGRNTILTDREGWLKDQIIIGKYFLQKYGDEFSNKIKSRLLLNISEGYSHFGERAKARQYVFDAIKLNPFYRANLLYLIIALIEDGAIRNFLSWNYQKYKAITELFQN